LHERRQSNQKDASHIRGLQTATINLEENGAVDFRQGNVSKDWRADVIFSARTLQNYSYCTGVLFRVQTYRFTIGAGEGTHSNAEQGGCSTQTGLQCQRRPGACTCKDLSTLERRMTATGRAAYIGWISREGEIVVDRGDRAFSES
jgi:hypothetical protein